MEEGRQIIFFVRNILKMINIYLFCWLAKIFMLSLCKIAIFEYETDL